MNKLAKYFGEQFWAILPSSLDFLAAEIERAEQTPVEEIKAASEEGDDLGVGGGIAVIPIAGPIVYRDSWFARFIGLTSVERLKLQLRAAAGNRDVKAIVLDVDSPGGGVTGMEELHAEMMGAREEKRIIAVANGLMASGAYWISSAASEIVASPSAQVGSIGVFGVHLEQSTMLENEGIKATVIRAGKYKNEANPFEPLTDEAREYMQSQVDEYYSAFVKNIAAGRGATAADVRSGYGEGRVVGAAGALSAGMVDKVAPLDEVLSRLVSGKWRKPRTAAEETGVSFDVAVGESPEERAAREAAREKPAQKPGLADEDRKRRLRLAKVRT